MNIRDELLAEVGPKTHVADICGRAADEILIKQMKIDQQKREIERMKFAIEEAYGCLWRSLLADPKSCHAREILLAELDGNGQRRGIQYANQKYGHVSDHEAIHSLP